MSLNTAPPASAHAPITTEEIKRRITQMYGWAEATVDTTPGAEASGEGTTVLTGLSA